MTTHAARRPAGIPIWFDLMTPNAEEARKFYNKIFGWEYHIGGPEYNFYTTALLNNQAIAGIGQPPPDQPMPPVWTVYISSDDVNQDIEKVKSLGGQVMMNPMVIGEQGSMAMCADPSGAVFGFWQPGIHYGAQLTDEHGSMTWCEVNSRDANKATDFYIKLCGLADQQMPIPSGGVYHMLNRNGNYAFGIFQMDPNWDASIPSHWLTYFAVSDLNETVMKATAAGAKVVVPSTDSPYGPFSVLSDPHGASFAVVQLIQRN